MVDDGSRMNREVHVGSGRARAAMPRATRLLRAYDTVFEAALPIGSYLVFIIAEGLIRASTGKRRIRSTSTGHCLPQRRN